MYKNLWSGTYSSGGYLGLHMANIAIRLGMETTRTNYDSKGIFINEDGSQELLDLDASGTHYYLGFLYYK